MHAIDCYRFFHHRSIAGRRSQLSAFERSQSPALFSAVSFITKRSLHIIEQKNLVVAPVDFTRLPATVLAVAVEVDFADRLPSRQQRVMAGECCDSSPGSSALVVTALGALTRRRLHHPHVANSSWIICIGRRRNVFVFQQVLRQPSALVGTNGQFIMVNCVNTFAFQERVFGVYWMFQPHLV